MHVLANSCHTYDVTIWLSRTTDNSNIFIRSREVRDNESRLYLVFVCVEVLRPSQPNGVMSSAVSLPNHMFTGQA